MLSSFKFLFKIDDIWALRGVTEIDEHALYQDNLNYMKWIEDILKVLSQYGVTGYIHVFGEEGQHNKIILDGKGNIRTHEAEFIFNDDRSKMLVSKDKLKNIIIEYYRRALVHITADNNVNYWGDKAEGFNALGYALFPDDFDDIRKKLLKEREEQNLNIVDKK